MSTLYSFWKKQGSISVIVSVVLSVLFVVTVVDAATTISTNISTGGTLSVTGASTLTGLLSMKQASSTRLSVVGTSYFGGTATSTFDSAGNLSVIGTLGVTGASTLTGLTSLGQASSTRLSVVSTAYFGGTATSTFSSAGALTLITPLGRASGGTATTTWLTGGIVFADGSTLTQGNTAAAFYIDKTNGRMGIGTSTPTQKLHVDSGAAATTTVEIGDIYSGTGKTCFNVAQANGSVASFFFTGGAIKVETTVCK